mgnify:CR=1 FL=1
MIQLDKIDDVFTLTMDDGENRWNTTFVREMVKALDEVEASKGPAALVTLSSNPKFFSNGLDLDWVSAPQEHPKGGDYAVFGEEFMALMGRIITLPLPTSVVDRIVPLIRFHTYTRGFWCRLYDGPLPRR